MKALLYISLLLSLLACQEKLDPDFNKYTLELQLLIPDSATDEIDTLTGIDVTFTNKYKDYSFVRKSDSTGYLAIEEIESGLYALSVSAEFPEEGVTTILNGADEIEIIEDTNDSLQLSSTFVQDGGGGFVIKEYYYSGSTTINEKNYSSDQFVDIYNNSDDTLMADSLLIVELESYGTGPNYWEYMQDDSIVVKTIWALPNKAQNHAIAPGEGFIIACDAMAHKGDSTYGNINSPVNLDKADFEFWSDYKNKDIDFAADNMVSKLWVYKGSEFNLHVKGGSAIALVKIPDNVDDYIKRNFVTKGTATSTSRYYCKIPNEWVIDAVECIQKDKQYKRFDDSLDAGFTFLDDSYLGLSVRRQVARTINGRSIYKDTNNSTVDFLKDCTPQPGIYE